MKVLQVNKFGTRTSGADNYFLDVGAKLAAAGHDVAYVAMRPKDVPTAAAVFEVPDVDFHEASGPRARTAAAARVMWSRTARAVMVQALDRFRPDVVHFHNYAHQLSSSVVAAANERGVPTFATAHDYKLICPAYTAMRGGLPCFRCAPRNPTHCLGGRCLHDSAAWSSVGVAEAAFVRMGGDRRVPRVVLAPSAYMAERLRESWLSKTAVDIAVLRNPVGAPVLPTTAPKLARPATAVYVGRLSGEKGLDVLIRAAAESGVPVRLVGDGPERASLEALAAEVGAPVQFAGFCSGDALEAEWRRAALFVMPSTWPENAPLALLEAFVRGLPAVLSDVGGLPELPAVYGGARLVPPGDVASLAAAMAQFASGEAPASCDVARLTADLSWAAHTSNLSAHYERLAAHAH